MQKKKRVAIIGTNGIPAKYGGFETLADNLVRKLSEDFNFTVYCSIKQNNKKKYYNNTRLINIPFNANGWQSILYDTLSLIHAWFSSDIILYFGPSAGFLIPLNKLFRKKIIVNHGGLNEWEREKLSWFEKKLIRFNHKVASKFSNVNIADNNVLKESIKHCFGSDSVVIKYGGDHVKKVPVSEDMKLKYSFLKKEYVVSVSRAQIDNNIHMLLETFSNLKNIILVLISNWEISVYGRQLKEKYSKTPNIILLDAIYDPLELNVIRSNAKLYIHSHSRCGTAPSLIEAMCLGLPIICFCVPTNVETTENESIYFKNKEELKNILINLNDLDIVQLGKKMLTIGLDNYRWEFISEKYKEIILGDKAIN